MKNQTLLIFFLIVFFNMGFQWKPFSLKSKTSSTVKLQVAWTVDTIQEKTLRPQLMNNSPPVLTKKLVIQGNLIDGIKAYRKDTGQKVWDFKIQNGVASSVLVHKNQLYFGGADGFFYSLQLETGRLNWKFFTGSENAGSPLIHEGRVYWTANNQKLYALSLSGKLLWIYSAPSPSKDFMIRGRPRPAIYKNWIYMGFTTGQLLALNKKTGKLQWQRKLSASHSINENLAISGNCLFVPVTDAYLFCIQPSNGKIRWKKRASSSFFLDAHFATYQLYEETLYAIKKFDGKVLWKKKIGKGLLPVSVMKNYLIYGFSSKGSLIFAQTKTGHTVVEHKFGRGLAAPVSVDADNKAIYFFSIDAYLHKVIVL